MPNIRIRFVRGTSIVSKLILFCEKDGWATHCECELPEGGYLGAHIEDGVQIRPFGYDSGLIDKEYFVNIPATYDQANRYYDYARSQLGKPYGILTLAGYVSGTNWRNEGSWMCSELQAHCYEIAFGVQLASGCNHLSPRDFLLILSAIVVIPDEGRRFAVNSESPFVGIA